MAEEKWLAISDDRQLAVLLDSTLDFHDAITASSSWLGAEYLTPSRHLVLGGYGTLILRVLSQFAEVPALELKFEKVKIFRYEYGSDLDPLVEFTKLGVRAKLLEWEIEAESLEYRIFGPPPLGEPERD